MSYSYVIRDRIIQFLDNDNWKYRVDSDEGQIKMGLTIRGKMKNLNLVIDLRDEDFLVVATYPLKADEAEYGEVRDLINRINYDMSMGGFEMDDRDGEIRFRTTVDCAGCLPSQKVIKNSIYGPAVMASKYGDAFVRVIMGVSSAKRAYEMAQD